jgi:hypothetical protein
MFRGDRSTAKPLVQQGGLLPFCAGIVVALPGYEINFQRGSPPDGRSIIDNIFSMLGFMYMGYREQDGTGDDSEISHRVRAPGAVGK